MTCKTWLLAVAVALATAGVGISGQARIGRDAGPGPAPVPAGGGRAAGRMLGEQQPTVDRMTLERGQGLYSVGCASCHGSDARGGETGPNLLRSVFILEDRNGELLLPVVRAGRPRGGMPPRADLSDAQIKDIAAFLRSLRTTGRDPGRNRPATIVVGNAAAGQAYFAATCGKCHAVTGDLKGIASKYSEPRQLQQTWLAGTPTGGRNPADARPPRIAVTLQSGEEVEGEQARLDDFIVSLKMPDGSTRTFSRNGDVPRIEIRDPLQAHRDLVPTYTDRDIHNVTAYLVTLQ